MATPFDTIIVATPHDIYFISEIEVQINNFRKFDYSKLLTVLVYEEDKDTKDLYREYWTKMEQRYPEVSFHYYQNTGLKQLLKVYPQVCRPWMLSEYWKANPDMVNKTFLYIDSDVLFTKPLELTVADNFCYLSRTDYISAEYFAKKTDDVMHHKKDDYSKIDILERCCQIVGVDKQVVLNSISGGCQYLLKGIDGSFWEQVMTDCIELRLYLMSVNQQYFVTEDKGFQSWCADMWAVLWGLWKRGILTECPEEMNFSWSSNKIEEYDKCTFLHNAGIAEKYLKVDGKTHKMFLKTDSRLRTCSMTMFDLVYDGISPDYCSSKYVEAIQEVKDPICVTTNFRY